MLKRKKYEKENKSNLIQNKHFLQFILNIKKNLNIFNKLQQKII